MYNKIPMSAIILAGGKSSRMGQNKALLPFGEGTLLEHLTKLVSAVFAETLIIADEKNKYQELSLSAEIHEDLFKDCGPLAGLYTGLAHSRDQASCVFTCDMPFVDEALIRELAGAWQEEYDVTCFQDEERGCQPFPAIYARSTRQLIHLLLEKGEASMRRFLDVAIVKTIAAGKEKSRALRNMNTPEEYQQVLKEQSEWITR